MTLKLALQKGDARYASKNIFKRGTHRVGFAGDSITYGGSAGGNTFRPMTNTTTQEIGDCPATYAAAKAQGWTFVGQVGYPGHRSYQVRADIQSSGILSDVDVLVLYSPGFWNDIGGSYTLAQTQANIEGIINDCLNVGVMPVLCSATPDGTSGTSTVRKTAAQERYRLMGFLARKYGLPTVDLWAVFADYTTAQIKSTYMGTANDVHPNAAGRKAGGEAVATVLNNIFVGTSLSGVPSAVDSDDLLGGKGWFLTDTNADGIADGWSGANGTGATWSRVSDSTFGYIQRCTTSALSGNNSLSVLNFPGSGGLQNHILEFSGWVNKSGTSQAQIALTDNTSFVGLKLDRPGGGVDDTVGNGHFCFRFKVPNGSGKLTLSLLAQAGTGTVDFAGLTVRDLTALGLAS
ncbi:MAG: SGNH/GDSL hydrolase family protein [Rhodanobacter sp.]